VDYADAFTGFGNLVIVDHGSNYLSLYGYLGPPRSGAAITWMRAPSSALSGTLADRPPALYFELRVDGRSIDPVQWLKPRYCSHHPTSRFQGVALGFGVGF
jgi:septal ring factor EnvC (AmiA/AmiB activator)